MQQNVNVEREPLHNLKGAFPSTFDDVKDPVLRNRNRGAILANIFERYTTMDWKGNRHVVPKNFSMMAYEMQSYIDRLPSNSIASAKSHMMAHLRDRGYYARN